MNPSLSRLTFTYWSRWQNQPRFDWFFFFKKHTRERRVLKLSVCLSFRWLTYITSEGWGFLCLKAQFIQSTYKYSVFIPSLLSHSFHSRYLDYAKAAEAQVELIKWMMAAFHLYCVTWLTGTINWMAPSLMWLFTAVHFLLCLPIKESIPNKLLLSCFFFSSCRYFTLKTYQNRDWLCPVSCWF